MKRHWNIGMVLLFGILWCGMIPRVFAREVTITDYRFFEDGNENKPYWWLEHNVEWKGVDSKYTYTRTRAGKFQTSEGETAFCIQPGIKMANAANHLKYFTYENPEQILSYSGLSFQMKEELELISYFGYGYEDDTSDEMYVATQLTIWNTVKPGSTQILDGVKKASLVLSKQKKIQERISNYKTKISFANQTFKGILGQEITIEDQNHVLENYTVVHCQNCEAKIEENTLIVNPLVEGMISVDLQRTIDTDNSASVLYASGDYQKMMTFKDPTNRQATLYMEVDDVEVKFWKRDLETGDEPQGEATFQDAEYGIYDIQGTLLETLQADEKGFMSTRLGLGTYTIKELKPPTGYQKSDEVVTFTITEDNIKDDIVIEVFDLVIRSNITITKKEQDTDIVLSDAKICLYNMEEELIACQLTDENGIVTFSNLSYGGYYYQEVSAPKGYEQENIRHYFDVHSNENLSFTLENKKVKIDSPETGDLLFFYQSLGILGLLLILSFGCLQKMFSHS